MIDTICISSGGLKGISFITALACLERNNYINIAKINKYTCVSVGSILGILLLVGYTLSEIQHIILELDYSKIKPELNLDLMIENYGFDNGENIIKFIKELVLKKINYNDDITFLELYNITKKEIYIATTNYSKNCERIFNFKETPNVSVFLAIRMSISIPLIYTPVLFENDYYVDGALINYVYILKDSEPENTLILYFKKYTPPNISSVTDILLGSIYIMIDQLIKKDIDTYHCLQIDCVDVVFSSETELTHDILNLLFLNGECSAEKFLVYKIKNKIKTVKQNIKTVKQNKIKDILNEIISSIEKQDINNDKLDTTIKKQDIEKLDIDKQDTTIDTTIDIIIDKIIDTTIDIIIDNEKI